ncbi:uncharacterized protein LOC119672983 [Teleopsis dalmanni]|uniref:uncharacterized protein LOC119672983 n=1 Tax=Teleopsis dalmanni TaxID=139649 RepID=UPI0018CD80B8|nr:uncharacterized protein LOC119672983 [Teleopsis dalmanni]
MKSLIFFVKMASNEEFSKLSAIMYQHLDEHEECVKKLCMAESILPMTDFYNTYESEVKEIESQLASGKADISIQTFANAFKSFDEYPVNLQKPKKKLHKDVSRDNTTDLRSFSENMSDITIVRNGDTTMSKEYASATKALTDFRKFRQNLKILCNEIKQQDITTQYAAKLRQLTCFASELEKLVPTDMSTEVAFDSNEVANLCHLAQRAEDLAFIQSNQQLFEITPQNNVARLDNIVDLLTHSLNSINCLN